MSADKAGPRFELWQRVTAADTSGEYEWMVWRVGPMHNGEVWFKTRAEAERWIADQVCETCQGKGQVIDWSASDNNRTVRVDCPDCEARSNANVPDPEAEK